MGRQLPLFNLSLMILLIFMTIIKNGHPRQIPYDQSQKASDIDDFLNSLTPGEQTPWRSLSEVEEKENKGRIFEWLNNLIFGDSKSHEEDEFYDDHHHHDHDHNHHQHLHDYDDSLEIEDYHDHNSHGFYPGFSGGHHFPMSRTPNTSKQESRVPHIRNVVRRPDLLLQGRQRSFDVPPPPPPAVGGGYEFPLNYNFVDNNYDFNLVNDPEKDFRLDHPYVRNK